jgi:hypothetical protein
MEFIRNAKGKVTPLPLAMGHVAVDMDVFCKEIIKLYQDHGTSEQFHSEFKTDMNLERLPSGKISDQFPGHVLGRLGLLGDRSPVRHSAKRRRIRTIIQELMYRAARLIETGRKLKLRFQPPLLHI